eukprot:scaffold10623_cov65-Cyclotella_meneghiniana.AAC.4
MSPGAFQRQKCPQERPQPGDKFRMGNANKNQSEIMYGRGRWHMACADVMGPLEIDRSIDCDRELSRSHFQYLFVMWLDLEEMRSDGSNRSIKGTRPLLADNRHSDEG